MAQDEKKLFLIKEKIQKQKEQIFELKNCVAATITKVSRIQGEKKNGPYDVLIYSENGKKKCKYIKGQDKHLWESRIQNYKKLKKILTEWMRLEMEFAQLELECQMGKKER